jgi:hypothetical protein
LSTPYLHYEIALEMTNMNDEFAEPFAHAEMPG